MLAKRQIAAKHVREHAKARVLEMKIVFHYVWVSWVRTDGHWHVKRGFITHGETLLLRWTLVCMFISFNKISSSTPEYCVLCWPVGFWVFESDFLRFPRVSPWITLAMSLCERAFEALTTHKATQFWFTRFKITSFPDKHFTLLVYIKLWQCFCRGSSLRRLLSTPYADFHFETSPYSFRHLTPIISMNVHCLSKQPRHQCAESCYINIIGHPPTMLGSLSARPGRLGKDMGT